MRKIQEEIDYLETKLKRARRKLAEANNEI